MKIVLATSNEDKVYEIKSFLKEFEILSLKEVIEPFEIEENGKSFQENALIKSKAVFEKIKNKNYIVLSDDSGISLPLLNNEPGIYSARYAGKNADSKQNLEKLINELKKRQICQTEAFYTAAIGISSIYGHFSTHGFMHGIVIDEKKGNNGFGYDPIFIPKGFDKTLGQLDEKIKLSISHRTKALELAKIILKVLHKGKKCQVF